MSSFGLIEENMELSHIYLAVMFPFVIAAIYILQTNLNFAL